MIKDKQVEDGAALDDQELSVAELTAQLEAERAKFLALARRMEELLEERRSHEVDGPYEAPVPERDIGDLYEENPFEVSKINPFKEQKAKAELPYNPFAANTLKTAAATTVSTPAYSTQRPPPPPLGSAPKKVNKNRPAPSREGHLKLIEGMSR